MPTDLNNKLGYGDIVVEGNRAGNENAHHNYETNNGKQKNISNVAVYSKSDQQQKKALQGYNYFC